MGLLLPVERGPVLQLLVERGLVERLVEPEGAQELLVLLPAPMGAHWQEEDGPLEQQPEVLREVH